MNARLKLGLRGHGSDGVACETITSGAGCLRRAASGTVAAGIGACVRPILQLN